MSTRILACLIALLVAAPSLATAAPISMERKLGADIVKKAHREMPLIDDYEINSFVRSIGKRLVATLGQQPFDYEFFVVRDDSINAFAVPGGKVFVHAGLIARVGSEDGLAGVLAHEIAHAHAHHAIRQQQKSAVSSYASLLGLFLGVLNPVLGQAAVAAGMSQRLKYQRDFEREADFLGIGYARKAGYDPAAMLQMLRVIYNEQKINPAVIPPYFLSHPLTGERMAYLEATLGENEWKHPSGKASWRLLRAQAIARANAQSRRKAVPDYEHAVETAGPKDRPAALELIGLLMCHGEDYELAERYLEQAEAAGRNVDRELGRAYLRKGELDKARPRLERAVAADPADWNATADLGALYYQQGDYDPAIKTLEKAVELYPWSVELERELGRALGKAGREGAGFYHFAHASEYQQQLLQALAYYRRALAALPDDDPLKGPTGEKVAELEKKTSHPPVRPHARPPIAAPGAPGSRRRYTPAMPLPRGRTPSLP